MFTYMKKIFLGLILSLIIVTPGTISAQTSTINNAALLQLIASLMQQVMQLQAQLEAMNSANNTIQVVTGTNSQYQAEASPLISKLQEIQLNIRLLEDKKRVLDREFSGGCLVPNIQNNTLIEGSINGLLAILKNYNIYKTSCRIAVRHFVVTGESGKSISYRYGVHLDSILSSNLILNESFITSGRTLTIVNPYTEWINILDDEISILKDEELKLRQDLELVRLRFGL